MAISLQVLYPAAQGTTFDHDYYAATHMPIVDQHMGPYADDVMAVRGTSGPDGAEPAFHAIATFRFKDQAALDAALGAATPALDDIPKFYSGTPQMLVGTVID